MSLKKNIRHVETSDRLFCFHHGNDIWNANVITKYVSINCVFYMCPNKFYIEFEKLGVETAELK